MSDAVGPQSLIAGAGERRSIENGGDEVFNAWVMRVGVPGERLLHVANAEHRAAERIKDHLAVGSDHAKLVALNVRVPAHVNCGMDAALVLNEHGGRIFDSHGMKSAGKKAGGAARLAKEEVQGINAMAGDVEKRAAPGHGWIEKPFSSPIRIVVFQPTMTVCFGENGPADGTFEHELSGANELGKESAVVGDGEEPLMSAGRGNHGLRIGEVHRSGFFAEDVLACAKAGNGLGRMKKDRRGNVDGVNRGGEESNFEIGEDLDAGICGGLVRVACDERLQVAALLGENGRDDATARDVANSDDKPANHDLIRVNDVGGFPGPQMRGTWGTRIAERDEGLPSGYCFLRTAESFSSARMVDSSRRKSAALAGGISTWRTMYSRS